MGDNVENPRGFFNSFQSESPAPLLLEPEHSIMERFQSALRQHLLRQKEKLSADIYGLRADLKQTGKNEDEMGMRLYGLKSDIALQQKMRHERQARLEELKEEKQGLSVELSEARGRLKKEREVLDVEKEKEMEMMTENEKLHAYERKVLELKKEMEDDLAVNLRVSEKTEADQKLLLEENRKLDMFIFRIMTEISKLESEAKLLDFQIEEKGKEKNLLNQTVADADADLQALASDRKRLLGDWNTLVVAMNQKDAAYGQAMKELSDSEEAFQTLSTEIENLKKAALGEMGKSEQLGLIISRAKKELEHSGRNFKHLLQKKMDLERNVSEITDLVVQAEKDLQNADTQRLSKEAELENVQKELEDMTRRSREMEDEGLNLLLEQSTNDKAAMHLNKAVKNFREKSRQQEVVLVELENRMSKLILHTEDMKIDIARNLEIIGEMDREVNGKQVEMEHINAETKEVQNLISARETKIMILGRKMEELVLNAGLNEVGLSPLEIRIRDAEWKIQDLKKRNDELQTQWMRQQNDNVKLTEQRNEQLKEVSLMRKQVILLDQKRMKLNNDIEREQSQEIEIKRNIANLQHRLKILSASLSTKSDQRHLVDRDLLLQQTSFIKSLKDSENEQMTINSEIRELETTLEERAENMLDKQRELLAWEKKVKLGLEAKQAVQKEKSTQGDIGQMKLEIHRMEVRLGQLRKVQEKLVTDLEQTIFRREAIVDEAEARAKRERGTNRNRAHFQRKLDEVRSKLKCARQEQKLMDKLIAEVERSHETVFNQINEKTERLKKLKKEIQSLDYQLEDGRAKYQLSVEILVRRQRKCKLYGLLKAGKYRPLYRNELTLENELGRARSVNGDLSAILEALVDDFPTDRIVFHKILNSLKSDVF